MPFNAQGVWVPEDDSASGQLNKLIAEDSPYIQQARASGTQSANRRGLLNSSMAAGAATGSAIAAAAPIAAQNASQIAAKNMAHQQGGYDMERQKVVTASADRNASLSAALESNKAYLAAFGQLADNKDIPAATRDAYLRHLLDTRSTGMDMIQQVYGIELNWAGKPQPGAGPTAAPPSYTAIAPTMPAGLTKDQQAQWRSEQAAIAARNAAAFGAGPSNFGLGGGPGLYDIRNGGGLLARAALQ